MKNYISGLFLLLILTACNTKNDADTNNTDNAKNENENYYMGVIGTDDKGVYTITNPDIAKIEQEWEKSIKKRLNLSNDIELKGFEIIKGKTKGDSIENYYILVSKIADGSITMAAILELKEGKFYFETKKMGDLKGYQTVICRGLCETGCNPVVKLQNGLKSLNCSACADCEKTDSEMY